MPHGNVAYKQYMDIMICFENLCTITNNKPFSFRIKLLWCSLFGTDIYNAIVGHAYWVFDTVMKYDIMHPFDWKRFKLADVFNYHIRYQLMR